LFHSQVRTLLYITAYSPQYRVFFGNQLQLGDPNMGATIATMMFLIILCGVCLYLFAIQRRITRYQF